MDYILKTNDLCKNYKSSQVLNGVNMHIPNGAIYGLVGKNGAGKTTLIRLISGIQNPTSGEYTLYNVKNTDKAIEKTRRRIGAVVETPAVYLDMTAKENLIIQYQIIGMPNYEGIEEILKLVGLNNTGEKKVKDFSLGMKQRLGIAIALCGYPDFLILDEPINGLDPEGIVEIRELILKLNCEYQITILISSHILGELSKLATHYGFIENGRIIKEIKAIELKEKCRKCIHLSVTNAKVLCRVLDRLNVKYLLTSEKEADIYGEVDITQLTLALTRENCEIKYIQNKNESLENYYMNLIGGQKNA